MNKLIASLLSLCFALTLAGCGQQEESPRVSEDMPTENVEAPVVKTESESQASEEAVAQESAAETPAETISETDDEPPADTQTTTSVQPSLKVGAAPAGPPTSARFKEGAHYHKIVPAQPTNVAPGKVELAEVFW